MSTSNHRLSLVLVSIFSVALLLQLFLLLAPIPTRAQNGDDVIPPTPETCAPNCITINISSIANPIVDGPYRTTFDIRTSGVVSRALWAGNVSGSLAEFLLVQSTAGEVQISPSNFTVTLHEQTSNFTISDTIVALEPGLHMQALHPFTTTVPPEFVSAVARARATLFPQAISLRYRSPGVIPAGTYTDTLEIRPNQSMVTPTLVAGQLFGEHSLFRSVRSNLLECEMPFISAFLCSAGFLSSQDSALITVTVESMAPGIVRRDLQVWSGGDIISHTLQTAVQAPVQQPAVQSVPIDIKPGGVPNSINPRSRGKTPVALLSTSLFDVVSEVDPTSLTFGRTGTENSWLFCKREDVNSDSRLDLICLFDTRSTGFLPGDTVGRLQGHTYSGQPIQGMDSVRIVGRGRP